MVSVVRMLCCAALCVILLELAGGCNSGPAKVDITGKVTKDGQLLKVNKKTGQIQVTFITEGTNDETTKSTFATFDVDSGTYAIKGIGVGKYRIIVTQVDPYPGNDLLNGAFNKNNSKIVRDVETNNQVIDIDLTKEAQ